MEGESTPPPPPFIMLVMLMSLAYVDYKKLWRCFVSLVIQIQRNQFMWKRNLLFFSIWISVIPALLGRLIDLMTIIPWQVTPVYSSLFMEWLIGLLALFLWSYQILFTRIDIFQTGAWQGKLERIKREGIDQLPFNWLIASVIGSAIQTLLASLIVPYLVCLLLGAFGATYAIQRLVWPAFLVLIAICFIYKALVRYIIHVHKVEYDRLYFLGYRLLDYDRGELTTLQKRRRHQV